MPEMWVLEWSNRKIFLLGHMSLERLKFDFAESPFVSTSKNLLYIKNTVMVGCVRGQAYYQPHIIDVLVMHRVVRKEVLEFIIPSGTKQCIILRDLRQDFLCFFVMYKTEMPRVNAVKDVQRQGIKLCTNFYEQEFLVGKVGYSREGGGACLRRGGNPGTLMHH